MKLIGICGGSGSGKSTVALHLSSLGYPVIDADAISREVVEKGSDCLLYLSSYFGKKILNEDGSLNRKKLAEIAFATKEGTDALNSITHGFIMSVAQDKIDTLKNAGTELAFFDAPLLFESGADSLCDGVVAVICDKSTRLDRIVSRDGLTKTEGKKRISRQLSERELCRKSDFTIDNSGTKEELIQKTGDFIKEIKKIYNI